MLNYLGNYPNIEYRFGSNENPVTFKDLSVYIDLIDQIQDSVSAYTKYTILSGDRPDIVSYKLYGSVDYYWTFYYLNPNLRESGWPLNDQDAYNVVTSSYPHHVVTTENNIAGTRFTVGRKIYGNTSTVEGTIIATKPDLGQIIIDSGTNGFLVGEQIVTEPDEQLVVSTASVYSTADQYNSVHHYEDTDGEYVDINPFNQSSTNGLIPVTYLERFIAKNNDQKQIKVLKREIITAVNSQFNALL